METKLQEMADQLTEDLLAAIYGERFEKCDDITEDEELSNAWEYINEKTFGMIWAAYDEGYADACEECEDDTDVRE